MPWAALPKAMPPPVLAVVPTTMRAVPSAVRTSRVLAGVAVPMPSRPVPVSVRLLPLVLKAVAWVRVPPRAMFCPVLVSPLEAVTAAPVASCCQLGVVALPAL